ncbi:MAG: Hsp20/alpha crystallin family protein [Candidatus Aenigmatarchaeota archaeon]|jgi:HSP20 family protein
MFEEDIFEELARMRRRIDRLMKAAFGSLESEVESFPVDISETENEIIVRADLPGFSKDEVSVNATENSIEISAEHKEKREEKGEKFYRIERRVGSFKRVLSLPALVEPEKAKAKMKDGVLEVILPKKEKKKGKEIKVE